MPFWSSLSPFRFALPVAAIALLASVPLGIGFAHADDNGGGPIMPVSEIRPGMKGYGLTVFRGTEPERFDVEVIGTVHQFRPHQDLILIKTSHPRLEIAKVVAGMSGSPVFINGRMIGAYAYGWQFGSEAIAGVTPIRAMLDELARPLPPVLSPLPIPISHARPRREARADGAGPGAMGSAGDASGQLGEDGDDDEAYPRFAGRPTDYDVFDHAGQIAERIGAVGSTAASGGPKLVPAKTPLLLGGMSDGAAKVARELFEPMGLEPMQAGGAGDDKTAEPGARFVDGGAIGVQMIRGDVSAMGLGTVTRVEGGKLVAFGHPMLGGGVSSLPTAVARVLWVLASQQRSFKIGEAVRPLGALVNDRQAAIVVDTKAKGDDFPVTVDIDGVPGAPHRSWSFTVAHEKFMAPSFLAVAVGSAIESTTSERRDVTWHASTELTVHGYGTLALEDFGISIGGTPDADEWARSRAVRAVGALLNNPWEPVRIDRVSTKLSVRFTRDALRLRGAEPLQAVLDAGQPARIRLHLDPFSGPEKVQVIEVPIPRELAGKDVDIDLSPGYRETPEMADPDRLSELIANLRRQSFAPDVLVASIKLPEQGVAFHGMVADRLPRGALDTLRPASDTVAPEPFLSHARTLVPISGLVEGKDHVRVHVRPVLR